MNCAIYARVSTRDKGQDTENQIREMREWAAREGHTVVAVYQDTSSGSGKVRRPEFERMMADAHSGQWCMLLFWSLDRLSREGVWETLQHLRRLDEAGVCWRSYTEAYLDSCGVFKDAVLAILAAVAKQERLRISDRVKAGLETARLQGRVGGRPVALRDPAVVERIMQMYAAGENLKVIAELTAMSKSTVHRIIQREETV